MSNNVGDFHHLVLEVTDLEHSEKFYEEVVGLRPVGRDLWPEGGPNATFELDRGQAIVLVQVPELHHRGPNIHHNITVSTEYWHEVNRRLKERDIRIRDFEGREELRAVGEISMTFWDPDGNRLQLAAYSDEMYDVPAAGRGKIIVGRVDEFAVGSVTHVKEGKFYLVRLHEGFLALNEVRTHMRCNVTYQPEHYRYWCACHDNRFNRRGEHLGHTPGVPPLHCYAIDFVDGQVVVDTDRSIPRTPEEAQQGAAIGVGGARR